MTHYFGGFSAGEVMFVGGFRLTPVDLLAYEQSRAIDDLLGSPPGRRRTPGASGTPDPVVPTDLLVRRALCALSAVPQLRHATLHGGAKARVSVLRAAVVGEPIECVATVRFTSEGPAGDDAFVTLAVELRGHGGATLARFEVGAELPGRRGDTPEAPERRLRAA